MTEIPVSRPALTDSLESAVSSVLRSRWWGYGPKCTQLESWWTERFGGWALATNSCTSALYLAARLLKATPGDEVIVPAITFASTAAAFLTAGLRVRCVDVHPRNCTLDSDNLEHSINSRTRAIVAVHLYGQRVLLTHLREVCDRNGVVLIEDCAHRLFHFGERPVGHMACFSFNAVKEAPAGEGGLFWGENVSLAGLGRTLSNVSLNIDTLERTAKTVHKDQFFCPDPGLKLRLNDIGAALVLDQLPLVESRRKWRRYIFDQYEAHLKPYLDVAEPLPRQDDDSYLMFVARSPHRIRPILRQRLADRGVATSVHYVSLAHNPGVYTPDHLPVASRVEAEVVTLPCFADMSEGEVGLVCDGIIDACEYSRRHCRSDFSRA